MTHTPPPLPTTPLSSHASLGRVRPAGWWYLFVPLLFLAGIGVGVVTAVDEGRGVIDSFSTLGSDGVGTVQLEAGDEATVFALWDDGRGTDALERPVSTVVVTGPGGEAVTFDEAARSTTSTYSYEGASAIDLGTFEAPVTGTYRVRVTFQVGPEAVGAPNAAVGRLDWSGIVGRVLRPVSIGFAASIALLVLLIVTRGMSKRRLRATNVIAAPPLQGHDGPASQGPISFS